MSQYDYSPPVDQLLEYGSGHGRWPNYLELGLTKADIPELIRMALDLELHWLYEQETVAVWAPIHAWRALAQLQAEEAAEPLLDLFDELSDSEWLLDELPVVFGMIGPALIPSLLSYLLRPSHEVYSYVGVAGGIKEIADRHPTSRAECVAALTKALENHERLPLTANGFIVYYLTELEGVEAASVMEQAFAAESVDESIMGGWGEVQYKLGLIDTPPPRTPNPMSRWFQELFELRGRAQETQNLSQSSHEDTLPDEEEDDNRLTSSTSFSQPSHQKKRKPSKQAKKKAKRKMQKKSRKRNRRR